jgi:hypothetical protein
MGRSTFEGPVLSGDIRFGQFRNVGYSQLVQNVDLDLSNAVAGTTTYSGGSGTFVTPNNIPNLAAVVYQPSATANPVVQTIPADTATNVYRGAVFYVPTGSDLDNIFVDCLGLVAVTGGSAAITSQTVYVSNNYTAAAGTAAYFNTGAISATGRQSLSTFSATQMGNQTSTTTDIYLGGTQPNVSQIVVTIAIVGTALDTRTALTGKYNFTLQYSQPDNNIGTLTTYPYGNFD